MHYRTHCCTHEPIQLAKQPNFDLGRLLDQIIREVFDNLKLSSPLREKLWAKYFEYFSAAVDVGYSPTFKYYSKELAANLLANISQFSAFKARSFEKSLAESLIGSKGRVSWNDFKKEGLKINADYNKRWLRTEYHQTVGTANMAGKWQDFQRTKDIYPNLRYETVGDERVRQKHKEWDGIVLPIDHPWWKTHYPPNDWGCRCDVIRTDAPPTKYIAEGTLKIEFKNNAAQSGKIFNKSAYEQGLSKTEKREAIFIQKRAEVKSIVKDLKTHYKGVIDTKRFGRVLVSKRGIEKTQNINKGNYEVQIQALREIQNIKKHLNNYKGEIVIEKPHNPSKLNKKPSTIGYVTIQAEDYIIALEKDRTIQEDYKFYYIKKVSQH